MVGEVRWLSYFVFTSSILNSLCSVPHRRFEYKYSFKPPNLAQKDGSVPFWEYGGNAIASSGRVRIAPSLRSQKGAMWSKSKTNFNWWEVVIIFRISGRGRTGADGLAFWYTEEKGGYTGDVFGSSDKWTGLGIFFDSFDNDNKHNNPYIMGVINDGTEVFDHMNDGGSQMIVPGCLRKFRNTPFPTRAVIEYYMNTLTVLFHNGLTNNEQDLEQCFRAENIYLPKEGHFGLSAATGSLADDHDVLQFLTVSLYPPGSVLPQQGQTLSPEEQQKLSLDYANYQRKLDQQKEEYRKDHPEAAKDDESEFDEFFESDSQRELRQIFYGQSQMFDLIRVFSQKLDEIVERQERAFNLLSALQGGVELPQVAEVPGGASTSQFKNTILRQEVDAVLNNQNSIISATREIRNYVVDIHSRADSILQNQARAPTAKVGYGIASLVDELRHGLNNLKRDAAVDAQKLTGSPGDCPNVNCVSTTVLLVIAVTQVAAIILYNLYNGSREAKAKKFY